MLPPGIKRVGLFVPGGATNRDKRGTFVPVGGSTRDKKPLSPALARLAVGPGIKATFCPGPKGNRDKWSGRKAYFVVVKHTFAKGLHAWFPNMTDQDVTPKSVGVCIAYMVAKHY